VERRKTAGAAATCASGDDAMVLMFLFKPLQLLHDVDFRTHLPHLQGFPQLGVRAAQACAHREPGAHFKFFPALLQHENKCADARMEEDPSAKVGVRHAQQQRADAPLHVETNVVVQQR
jgi:hypothetical protein